MKCAAVRTLIAAGAIAVTCTAVQAGSHSVARQWNDLLLDSIRNDFARPTVHARNLYHISTAMWDAWAAFDDTADQHLHIETAVAADIEAAREEVLSYASYRLLIHRFTSSPGAAEMLPQYDALMDALGYDKNIVTTVGPTNAALGNRIAATIIAYGLADGSNELHDYANAYYEPVNPPLAPEAPGNPDILFPDRWQPLALDVFIDQGDNVFILEEPLPALSPEWGLVANFALDDDDLTIFQRDGDDYWVYNDPGPPPYFNGVGDEYYRWGNEMVVIWSSHLDSSDGVMWDISPASFGNSPTPGMDDWATYYDFYNGNDWGIGYTQNPVTGLPYDPQIVPRGDYGRALAEFWADGPDSETPPGHWFTILHTVSDHPLLVKQLGGKGPVLNDLEWDVKTYLALGGAMHDIAVSAWGIKGWYDYVRPVSAIRFLADNGQRSDPLGMSYSPDGITLYPGYIEVVTPASSAPGERHAHLVPFGTINHGKIAIYAWRGPEYIFNPDTDEAGVGWILAEDWWPYQRPSFVTPPFPGYVSGHSTYSRGAALVMTALTGNEYFPSGKSAFTCLQNDFLVFEEGPSMTIELEWARYLDASDQTSLSRIWGGIHPPADDIPGRLVGEELGPQSLDYAIKLFNGQVSCPTDSNGDGTTDIDDLVAVILAWGTDDGETDMNDDGVVDVDDLVMVILGWGSC